MSVLPPPAALRPVRVVAWREVVQRARSASFRLSTAVLLLGVVLGVVLPTQVATSPHATVGVTGASSAAVATAATAEGAAAGVSVRPVQFPTRDAAVAALHAGRVDAVVVGTSELLWRRQPDGTLGPVLRAAVAAVVVQQRAAAAGIDPARLRALLHPPAIAQASVEARSDSPQRVGVATAGLVLLFVSINFYGSFILLGVIEEKSSRVVEVLLARLRPGQLLAGKILGIALLGLAQTTLLAVVAVIALAVVHPANLPSTTYAEIGQLVLWFLLGYSFYSVVYAALGSLVSRAEDAQSTVGPLTVLMLLAYLASFAALQSPDAGWVAVLSFLPPSAPMVMPIRVALTSVPPWQLAAAVLIMIASVLGLVRVAARLYRGAVLQTGGKVRLGTAWRLGAA